MFMAQRNATIPSGLTCGASMFTIRRRRYTLQRLLAIFGELDTTEGVKANVSAIRQILDQAGRRDYTVKVYPNRSHNLMEVPPDNPNEFVRLKRSHRVSSKRWSTGRQHRFAGMHRQGVRPLTLWLQIMYLP